MAEDFEQLNLGDEPKTDQEVLPSSEIIPALLETERVALVQKTIESRDFVPNQSGYQFSDGGVIKAVSAELTNVLLLGTFLSGEAITDKDAVAISDGTLVYTEISVPGNTNRLIFGTGSSANDEGQRIGQSFVATRNMTLGEVTVSLDKQGSPVDNVVVTIQGDSSGSPDGTPIGSSPTLAGGSITGTLTDYSFVVNATLVANTTYWIVLERSGASSAVNYYRCDAHNGGNPYTKGLAKVRSYVPAWGNAFNNTTSDIRFALRPVAPAGNVLRANSTNNDGRNKNFIGFAQSTVIANAPIVVVIMGIVELTGLSAGSLYYLSTTDGAIASSPSGTTRKVGIAVSTTKLLITNNW